MVADTSVYGMGMGVMLTVFQTDEVHSQFRRGGSPLHSEPAGKPPTGQQLGVTGVGEGRGGERGGCIHSKDSLVYK